MCLITSCSYFYQKTMSLLAEQIPILKVIAYGNFMQFLSHLKYVQVKYAKYQSCKVSNVSFRNISNTNGFNFAFYLLVPVIPRTFEDGVTLTKLDVGDAISIKYILSTVCISGVRLSLHFALIYRTLTCPINLGHRVCSLQPTSLNTYTTCTHCLYLETVPALVSGSVLSPTCKYLLVLYCGFMVKSSLCLSYTFITP